VETMLAAKMYAAISQAFTRLLSPPSPKPMKAWSVDSTWLVNNNNSAKSENTTGKCTTAAVLLYCLLLICTVAAAYLEYMARRCNMCTDIVYACVSFVSHEGVVV
jgi:hypothetical protein